MKKKKKMYEFEDLMRVRRAAILTSKVLGQQLKRFCPEAFCGRLGWRGRSSSTTFIALDKFSSYCIYFKALLPGITKKDMRRILWKIRARRDEFIRRSMRREALDHMKDEYQYRTYWKMIRYSKDNGYRGDRSREVHALTPQRLYPMDPTKYTKFFERYAKRHTEEITAKGEIIRKGWEHAVKWQKTTAYNIFAYQSVSFEPQRVIDNIQLKDREHSHDTVWCAPYKDANGRGGILMVIQLPRNTWTIDQNSQKNVVRLEPKDTYAVIGKPVGIEFQLGIDWLAHQWHIKDGGESNED